MCVHAHGFMYFVALKFQCMRYFFMDACVCTRMDSYVGIYVGDTACLSWHTVVSRMLDICLEFVLKCLIIA